MKQRHSELAIDLYRGVAALMVLLAHAIHLTQKSLLGTDTHTYDASQRLLAATLGLGTFWVWGFFVVSGFCIHQSIQRERERGALAWRRYALARITRIYPVFIVGLVLAVVSWWITGGDANPAAPFPIRPMLATLVFAQQFTSDFPGFDPAWSLSNEALYYVLWPAALVFCGWNGTRAIAVAGIASVALTTGVVVVWKMKFGGDATHWLVPVWCMAGLFVLWLVGAALASRWERIKSVITPRVAIMAGLGLLTVYACQSWLQDAHARTWAFMLAAYLSAPCFAMLIAGGHWLRLGDSPTWSSRATWLGTLSYPCYILHKPLQHLVEYGLMPNLPVTVSSTLAIHLACLVLLPLLVICTAGIALERTVMSWRAHLLKRVATSVSGAARPLAVV